MQVYQNVYQSGKWTSPIKTMASAQLVLVFGSPALIAEGDLQADLRTHFPHAEIIGCSTSGEIQGEQIFDDSLCLTALGFDRSHVVVTSQSIDGRDLFDFAATLGASLPTDGLKAVFVLSDGKKVNGTALVNGLAEGLPEGIPITGGLAGDGTRFEETVLWHNDSIQSEQVILCGFYGDRIQFKHGCEGGWSAFGPERTITGSQENVLLTLDDQPALALYKKYLGKYADELPSSALLFPLQIEDENTGTCIRTILGVDADQQTMTFAGDIPQGASARLMHSTFSDLIEGANQASESALGSLQPMLGDGLAILISCVGRRLLMKSRSVEEVEAISESSNGRFALTGFYSYGELSPLLSGEECFLHNQTMTMSVIYEADE